MQTRELLGTAQVPGGAELSLYRRGDDFMITLDRNELMSTRMSGSEVALAEMAFERLGKRPGLHFLIGGYGMGFTLRAALAAMDAKAQLTVAELVPEIIAWIYGLWRLRSVHAASPLRALVGALVLALAFTLGALLAGGVFAGQDLQTVPSLPVAIVSWLVTVTVVPNLVRRVVA